MTSSPTWRARNAPMVIHRAVARHLYQRVAAVNRRERCRCCRGHHHPLGARETLRWSSTGQWRAICTNASRLLIAGSGVAARDDIITHIRESTVQGGFITFALYLQPAWPTSMTHPEWS